MFNTTKKIVASVTALACALWMVGNPALAALTEDQIQSILDLLESFGADSATVANVESALTGEPVTPTTPTVAGCTITSFDRNLSLGTTGDDVKCLQIVLNSDSATQLAASGVGSAGNETSYFGPLTKAAVIKFQEKYSADCLDSWGLTAGTGYVGSTTRAKLNTMLAAGEEEEEEEEEEVLPGLTVALSANTPAINAIPLNAASVPFLMVDFTAGSDADATIDDLTFMRVGAGKAEDFEAVYLYDGATRLTDGRGVSAIDNGVTFTNVDYTVEAGETATLTLKGDLKDGGATPGRINAFQIASSADVTTLAEINGTFPITGNVMNIVNVVGGDVAVADDDPDTPVNIGDTDVTIVAFNVEAGGEDIALQSITLTQNGSASLTELDNIVVEKDGEEIGEVTISGDQLIIAFEDETIEEGDEEDYEVKADISASVDPDADAISLNIEEKYDVVAIGLTYGFGVVVDLDDFDVQDVTVEGGEMNLSYVGPQTQDIGAGDGIKVFSFKVANADELKVKNTVFTFVDLGADIAGDGVSIGETYFDNFRFVYDATGKALDSTDTITDEGDDCEVTFTNDYTLASGETTLNLLVNIDEDIYDEGEVIFSVELNAFGANDVKDLDTGEYLVPADDIIPNGLTGKDLTVLESGLEVDKANYPEEQDYVAGEEDAKLAGFVFTAVGAENIIVEDVDFDIAVTDPDPGDTAELTVASVYLEDGSGNLIASAENVDGNEVEFDNIDWEIEATKTETLVVVGDIKSDANATDIQFTLDAVNYETADTKKDGVLDPNEDGQLMGIGVGELSVKLDASTPDSTIAVAGEEDVVFSIYEFEATTEDYRIEKITVGGWLAGDADNLDALYLESSEGTATKTSIAGVKATFTGLDWVVEEGDSLKVTVSADINDLSNDENQSTEDFTVQMGDDDEIYDFRAIGISSGEVVQEGLGGITLDGDLSANEMTVYESKPIIEFVSLSDKVLVNATKTIYKFTVDVDDVGDEVIMNDLKFFLSGTLNITIDDAKLYKVGKTAAIADADDDVVIDADGVALTFTDVAEEISSSATYYVKATLGTADAPDKSLSTRFDDSADAFGWSDGTAAGADIDSTLLVIPDDTATLSN